MRRTRALLPAVILALLAGCASTPKPAPPPEPQVSVDAKRQAEFDRSLDRWHGAKVSELVAKLGQPSSTGKQPNGGPIYVYSKTAKLSGPTGPSTFSCVVRYLLDERGERVVGHSIEGC